MTKQLHRNSDLICLFNDCFRDTFNTVLVKGDSEPLYLPAESGASCHQIIFAHGYFSSALHEISHWCIAGEQRRTQLDYGYWYLPDGRSESQQMQFEQVEIKPQALEWIFSVAAKHRFHMSIDNLGGEAFNRPLFANNLSEQVLNYLKVGMPVRAQTFAKALADFYQGKIIQEAFDPKSL